MTLFHEFLIAFSEPVTKENLGAVGRVFERDVVAVGHTPFGDLLIQDIESSQMMLTLLSPFDVIPLDAFSISEVVQLLTDNSEASEDVLQLSKAKLLVDRFGPLCAEEIFIPVPIPALGGDGSIDSYEKGDLWTHLEMITQ